jgi:hypothetical protein
VLAGRRLSGCEKLGKRPEAKVVHREKLTLKVGGCCAALSRSVPYKKALTPM